VTVEALQDDADVASLGVLEDVIQGLQHQALSTTYENSDYHKHGRHEEVFPKASGELISAVPEFAILVPFC
jgi:hypothetical protein